MNDNRVSLASMEQSFCDPQLLQRIELQILDSIFDSLFSSTSHKIWTVPFTSFITLVPVWFLIDLVENDRLGMWSATDPSVLAMTLNASLHDQQSIFHPCLVRKQLDEILEMKSHKLDELIFYHSITLPLFVVFG